MGGGEGGEEREGRGLVRPVNVVLSYFPSYCLDTIRRRSLTPVCNLTRQRHLGGTLGRGVCARHVGVKTWVFHGPFSCSLVCLNLFYLKLFSFLFLCGILSIPSSSG